MAIAARGTAHGMAHVPAEGQAGCQATVATTATTTTTPFGFTTQAQGDNLVKLVNDLRQALVNAGIIV